jgi:hypothetical protein
MAAMMALRRPVIVVSVVVVIIFWIQRTIVTTVITARRRILSMLDIVRVVLRLLACLLPLPSLHSCLLQQSALFRKPSSLLPVFHLILPNQGLRRASEDIFIFAELADPGLTRRVVKVGILLLRPPLASSICVQL